MTSRLIVPQPGPNRCAVVPRLRSFARLHRTHREPAVCGAPQSRHGAGSLIARPSSCSGPRAPMFSLVKLRLASIALQVLALVAVLVWFGGPGPFFGLLVARILWWRYLVNDGD